MEEGLEHCKGGSDQNYPKENEMKEGKEVVGGALQIEAKCKEEREIYTKLNAV